MAVSDVTSAISYPYVAATLLAAIVLQVLYTVYYRLYLHTLADIPGPFWAKLSRWPSYLKTKEQDRHLWLLELQEKYGTVHP
jgi:hypothetical protein